MKRLKGELSDIELEWGLKPSPRTKQLSSPRLSEFVRPSGGSSMKTKRLLIENKHIRKQEITIVSFLTAIGMAISRLVLALTDGGNAPDVPSPAPRPPDKGGVKEWIKKHLQALGRALANLVGKAAGALPGIIGSIVSRLLGTLGKAASWLAENLWGLAIGVGTLLLVAASDWLARSQPKRHEANPDPCRYGSCFFFFVACRCRLLVRSNGSNSSWLK